jgi:hypothetical protein
MHAKMLVDTIKEVQQDVKNITGAVKNQQQLAGNADSPNSGILKMRSKAQIAYDMAGQQEQQKSHDMLAKTLATFAIDFGKVMEALERMMKDLEPTILIIEEVVKIADSNGDVQQAKTKCQQASNNAKKTKDDITQTEGIFDKTTSDFGGVADGFDKNREEPKVERKPVSNEPTQNSGTPSNNNNQNSGTPTNNNQQNPNPQAGPNNSPPTNNQSPRMLIYFHIYLNTAQF